VIGFIGLGALFVAHYFYFSALWLAAVSAMALLMNIATRNDDPI
jgi:hypothetical protein